jgi:hypothetical protein
VANEFTTVCSPDLGALAGRLQPVNWTAQDGSYVLCFGADRLDFVVDAHPGHRLGINGFYPTAFTGGETLQVAVDGGSTQTVTFAATDQTIEDVIAAVNTQVTGATASDEGGELRVESDTIGFQSTLQIVGGTGMTKLGHIAATGNGYGGLQVGDYVGFSQAAVDLTSLTMLTFGMKFVQPTNTGIKFKLSVLVAGNPIYEVVPADGETIDAVTRTVNVAAVTGSQTLEFRLEVISA